MKIKTTVIIGSLLFLVFFGGYFLGFEQGWETKPIEGYEITIREDTMLIPVTFPVYDIIDVEGSIKHPSIVRIAMDTIEDVNIFGSIFNEYFNPLIEFENTTILIDLQINNTETFFFEWMLFPKNQAQNVFMCEVWFYIEVWNWKTLKLNVEEWKI